MPKEEGYRNCIPQNTRTPEERRRIASMGGKAAKKKRDEQRTFKVLLEAALASEIKNKEGESKTRKEVSMLMLADKCARGDLKAIALAHEMLGEAEAKKIELTGKNGKDLMEARRLTPEEIAKYQQKMEEEY